MSSNNNNNNNDYDKSSWKRQSDFTPADIKKRVQGFTKLESNDIETVEEKLAVGMQIRYISYDKKRKEKTLKMGGLLQYIDPQGRFLRVKSMINNTIPPFSVQLGGAEIYYKNMGSKNEKFKQLVDLFGTEERLDRFISSAFDVKEDPAHIDQLINYCNRHCKGRIIKLIKEHQDMRKVLGDRKAKTDVVSVSLDK